MNKVELEKFIKSMEIDDDGVYRKGKWTISSDLPCHDFNKESIGPNTIDDYPDGILGIRVDDDFWIVATLPYEFDSLSIEELVSVIWPDVENPTFN